MVPTTYNYPFFEANQVLTNRHLNQLFAYLDEQERLTRANLIGIGIVCGLEISLEGTPAAPAIRITKGCGVTSQGYLIVEPEDVLLVSYQPTLYKTPDDLAYDSFKDPATNADYPMWEIFPTGEPNTTPLGNTPGFLNDKAVLLFLELKREGLRNCSPNNCDDKGAEITITLRRLLIRVDDLAKVIAAANQQSTGLTPADIEASLLARLNLPDLRMPRYDVPNTEPATSQQVLNAFLSVFPDHNLVDNTWDALSKAYTAFAPVVQGEYTANPFPGLKAPFNFLQTAPANSTQVRFLQYYYDFFDDLLKAYDEFRWAGFDLMCACCPPEGLFPRHLMLGVLYPATVANPSIYRHTFLASAAISGCEERSEALLLLFRRIVEMITAFTNMPVLRPAQPNSRVDAQIRITPSKLGDVALSEKAIPYYYRQTGTPPLYRVWSAEKARRNRANQNFSYRSNEYAPAAPVFIEEGLKFDLEPSNFLRIEGHLGKNFQQVLTTLLLLKAEYRLPIEIIALRTGAFDENMPIDLSKETCRFQDLDAQYSALREELRCFIYKQLDYLYDPAPEQPKLGTQPTSVLSKYPFFYEFNTYFQIRVGSVGHRYEQFLSLVNGKTPFVDPSAAVFTIEDSTTFNAIKQILPFLHRMHEALPETLQAFNANDFVLRYAQLQQVASALEKRADEMINIVNSQVDKFEWEELDDRVEDILYHCRPTALKALSDEYLRRIKEVKQKQFFSYFARQHPGLQHKGGVPIGGTFIVVYHDDPEPVPVPPPVFNPNISVFIPTPVPTPVPYLPGTAVAYDPVVANAFARINANPVLTKDPDIRTILGTFTGQVAGPNLNVYFPWPNLPAPDVEKILNDTVEGMIDGTVIADFYLPYICCSDCSPVQFVLPAMPLGVSLEIGCTTANRQSEIIVKVQGGVAPFSYNLNSTGFKPLTGNLALGPGAHTLVIRDDAGAESAVQTIDVPEPISFGAISYDCLAGTNEYVAVVEIKGGVPPYTADKGTIDAGKNIYLSDKLPAGELTKIEIKDSRLCKATLELEHSCLDPLTLAVQVGCASPNNVAAVVIVPSGGDGKYQLRVGTTGSYDSIAGTTTLNLPSGKHTLQLRDGSGATAVATVDVPTELKATLMEYVCEGTANYFANIQISGGRQPYKVNDKEVPPAYRTGLFKSGEAVAVTIVDANQCRTTLNLQHACADACGLPCNGLSRRCSYRLFIQPPNQFRQYEVYTQDSPIKVRVNGKALKLGTAEGAFQFKTTDLNSDFPGQITAAVKKLNTAIEKGLKELGNSQLLLSYDEKAVNPFAFLMIEYFECETFSLEFDYTAATPAPTKKYRVRYTNEPDAAGTSFNGVILTDLETGEVVRLPAFTCQSRDRCKDTPFVALCDARIPRPIAQVIPVGNNRLSLTGTVTNLPETDIVAWIWDVPRAEQSVYQGKKVEAFVSSPSAGVIRLTVVTKTGCVGFVDATFAV